MMGKSKGKAAPNRKRKHSRAGTGDGWRALTWEDLKSWAGSRSVTRGRAYQRRGAVEGLAISSDDALLADVQGTRRYFTTVWLQKGKRPGLRSRCSCPVGADGCKHAVAVVATYLQALADEADVPQADPDDPRWDRLSRDPDEWPDDDLDEASELEEDEAAGRASPRRRGSAEVSDQQIREDLAARPHEQLVDLVMSLMGRFPELRQEYRERILLRQGDADRLVRDTRREIRQVTAEPGWWNPWEQEGNIPDYSRLKHRLERLVELGQADAVVELGRELIDRGMQQVEQSLDEGETAVALSECVEIVFAGVERSTLSAPQKILFAVDAYLRDDFDIVGEAGLKVLHADDPPETWSAVVDEMHRRLRVQPKPAKGREDFHRRYERDQLTDWLATALERAGREDELATLYEREARLTGSYERFVRFLLDRKRYDEAQRWASEGIEQTRETWPGIASNLAGLMAELARQRKQWDVVAAHAAWRFFDRPSHEGFKELLTAAGKARCREKVRTLALRFLETGRPPIQIKTSSSKQGPRVSVDPDWPLPVPEHLIPLMRESANQQPHHDVLLEMALADKRPDDILHWYEKIAASGDKGFGWRARAHGFADRVAEAVVRSHPERALAIYEQRLEANLKPAQVSAYEACASFLRKMRPIMKRLGREQEWTQLLSRIREEYRRRPRFMEILDELDGQPIVRSSRTRRTRR